MNFGNPEVESICNINYLTVIKFSLPIRLFSQKMKDSLKHYLKSFDFLSRKDIENFASLAVPRSLSKSDYFIKEGESCKEVAFVISGILRSFYINQQGEEYTYCFTFPQNLMTAYSSYITCQGASETIQAITEVELLVLPKEKLDELSQTNIHWMKFSKLIAEIQYVELEKRIMQLQSHSASKRYSDLIENHPDYIQLIPLQYLSSYLGITQRHLSRIRKEYAFRQMSCLP